MRLCNNAAVLEDGTIGCSGSSTEWDLDTWQTRGTSWMRSLVTP
jgi:hypothetical protein